VSPSPFIAGGCVLLFLAAGLGVMTWRRTFARRAFMLSLLALVALLTTLAGNQILGLTLAAGVLILGFGCVAVALLTYRALEQWVPSVKSVEAPKIHDNADRSREARQPLPR
jgi:hypothetical protein